MKPELTVEMSSRGKLITVELYGRLKDQLGFVENRYRTAASTPAQLWQELIQNRSHHEPLAPEIIRPVINDAFAAWDDALAEGDRVAFLPPSSGG